MIMKNTESSIEIGKTRCFGKLLCETGKRVHFLVFQEAGPSGKDGYLSIILEYGQVAWDESEAGSLAIVFHQTKVYLDELNQTPEGRAQRYSLLAHTSMEEYWGIYRKLTDIYGDPQDKAHRKEVNDLKKELSKYQTENRELSEAITGLKVDVDSMEHKIKAMTEKKLVNA